MPATTRGTLPASVYWRRRLVLLTVLGLLAIAILKVTGSEGDPTGQATIVTAPIRPQVAYSVVPGSVLYPTYGDIADTPIDLPEPDGACQESDIRLTPETIRSRAGEDVWWRLMMSTKSAAACTFVVSPTSVQMRVTSGANIIWSTLDCPRALTPKQEVVIGRTVQTPVTLSWSAKRSSSRDCTDHGNWVMPGTYKLTAAILGGRVASTTFDLS
ncbi:MAG: hypothetical protein ACSLEW_13655 [Nocardioides sp.]